ncbi:MAG: hypothetical protein IKQ91_07665 [Oscillospiraceae bacterium]|nr:hypothetical protein [Oscillospiraceae bacterium]
MKKLFLKAGIVCGALWALSIAAAVLNIYTLNGQIQTYLLAAAVICIGIFILKTVKSIITLAILAVAAAVLWNMFMPPIFG